MNWADLVPSVVVFVAAFVQGAAGVGYAMLAVPMLALMSSSWVPGPVLIGLVSLALMMVLAGRRAVDPVERRALIPAVIVGTLCGLGLITVISQQSSGLIFGIVVLVAVLITASGIAASLTQRNLWFGGIASGLMGTVTGMHGPPLAILYARQSPEKARAAIAWIFLVAGSLSLLGYALTDRLTWQQFGEGVSLIPGTALGYLAARAVQNRAPVKLIRIVMLSLVTASAVLLIIKSL
jgi:uncharacterized membrane protein YfcA